MIAIIRDSVVILSVISVVLIVCGCESQRPNLSERHVDELLSIPAEATTASRQLVEHDARSRKALIDLHTDVQAELAEIGRRQEQLDQDRKALAAQRRLDPIIATAIDSVGLLGACLLPLIVVAILLWRRQPQHDADAMCDYLAAEVINLNDTAKLEHSPPSDLSANKPAKSK